MFVRSFLFLILCFQVSHAQSWFNPGQKWVYKISGFPGYDGYEILRVDGDTTIADRACKVLETRSTWTYHGDTATQRSSYRQYVYEEGERVFFYVDANTFYKIYDFTKQVGDTLSTYSSFVFPPDESARIIYRIDSVGTLVIDQERLKYQIVTPIQASPGPPLGSRYLLVEKLGMVKRLDGDEGPTEGEADGYFILPRYDLFTGVLDVTEYRFQCYVDGTTTFSPEGGSCDPEIVSAVSTASSPFGATIVFPNPATERIELRGNWLTPSHKLFVRNMTGQPWLQWENPNEQLSIDHLPAGTYLLVLQGDEGLRVISQFIKY